MRRLAAMLMIAVWAAPALAESGQPLDARTGKRGDILKDASIHIREKLPDPGALFSRARALAEQNKVNEAIEIYTALTRTHPELAEPYNNLGVLLLWFGQYERAESTFTEALRIQPGYVEAQENLGDAHVRMAMRAYDRAARLDPDDPGAREKIKRLRPIIQGKGGVISASLSEPRSR